MTDQRLESFEAALVAAEVPTRYRQALLDELQAHVALRQTELCALGAVTEDAWAQAVNELGPPELVAAAARQVSWRWAYRAPVSTFVVGPALAYMLLAVGLVPAVAAVAFTPVMLTSALDGLAAAVRLSAIVGAALYAQALSTRAASLPGLERFGLAGGVAIAALSGLVHPSTTVAGRVHVFRIMLEPSRALWQMVPVLAVLAVSWWRRCGSRADGFVLGS